MGGALLVSSLLLRAQLKECYLSSCLKLGRETNNKKKKSLCITLTQLIVFLFCGVTLVCRVVVRDYPSLPASSPCYDLFPLLQHHPPLASHLCVNWTQWTDRFYLHRAGCMPNVHFRCLVFRLWADRLGQWNASQCGLSVQQSLYLKGIGFQK